MIMDLGNFDWGGGSKLWFRKDCLTILWQIASPPHPHTPDPLIPVARSCTLYSLAPSRVLEFYS